MTDSTNAKLRELRERVAAGKLVKMPFDALGGVRIMAWAEGYAMVRRPGCMPFIKHSSDLLYLIDAMIQEAGR